MSNNVEALKELAEALTGTPAGGVPGNTNAEIIDYMADNYKGQSGGGTGGKTIKSISVYVDGDGFPKGGAVTYTDESSTEIVIAAPVEFDFNVTANGDNLTLSDVPTLASGQRYKYKLLDSNEPMPATGEDLTAWDSWNGTSVIASNGESIIHLSVCDTNNRNVKCGTAYTS